MSVITQKKKTKTSKRISKGKIVAIFFFIFIPVTAWIVICEVTNIDIRNLTNNIKQIAIDVDRIDNELRVKMPSENEQALEWTRQRPTRLMQIYQTTRKMEDQLLTINDNARYLYDRLNKLHAIRREKIPDVSRYNDTLKTAKSLVPVELDNFLEKAALLLDKNKKNIWDKLFNGNKVRENVDLKEIGAAAKEMGQLVKTSLKISDETKNAITELYIQDISQIKRGLERIEHIGRKIVSVAEGLAVVYSDGINTFAKAKKHVQKALVRINDPIFAAPEPDAPSRDFAPKIKAWGSLYQEILSAGYMLQGKRLVVTRPGNPNLPGDKSKMTRYGWELAPYKPYKGLNPELKNYPNNYQKQLYIEALYNEGKAIQIPMNKVFASTMDMVGQK